MGNYHMVYHNMDSAKKSNEYINMDKQNICCISIH